MPDAAPGGEPPPAAGARPGGGEGEGPEERPAKRSERQAAQRRRREGRKLLVLDLNGLLVHRERARREGWPGKPVARKVGNFWAWPRPHLRPFVEFCLAHFEVAVFSSAQMHNVMGLVDMVFGPGQGKRACRFIWDQKRCKRAGKHPENRHKPLFLKPLAAILGECPEIPADQVLLIDDSPYKCVRNPPHTAIHPPTWDPDQADDAALGEGGQLRTFLEGLAAAANVPDYVSAFVATHPAFGTGTVPDDILGQIEKLSLA